MDIQRKKELIQRQIASANAGIPANFSNWKNETEVVLRAVFGEDHPIFTKFTGVRYRPSMYTSGTDFAPYQASGVRSAISVMESGLLELDLSAEIEEVIGSPVKAKSDEAGNRVFIVHGHDGEKKHELARVLRELTGIEPTILHEQADQGQVLIEKFEKSAAATGYAVVLLTADDLGGAKAGTDQRFRARQNVVFEMGFFFGAFGRERVGVLLEEGVEEPGDVKGLVYTPLDAGGAWKSRVARELQAAGISVDWEALGRV